MGDEVAMRFVGGPGQWLPGVPARDLNADEVARWPVVEVSPLYEFVTLPQGEVVLAGGTRDSEDDVSGEEAGDE